MIKCDNISLKIGDKTIFSDITFRFTAGKFYTLLGPNGGGKTSLLKCISGLLPFSSGEIYYLGKSIKNCSIKELAKFRAVLAQNFDVTFPFKVSEIISFGRHPHSNGKLSANDLTIINEVVGMLGLAGFMTREFKTLSGGEQQKVIFAKTLVQVWDQTNPVLFLDEPESYLDIKNQIEILNICKKLTEDKNFCIISILHNLGLAKAFADEVILLKDGKIKASGVTADILTEKNISELFDIENSYLKSLAF